MFTMKVSFLFESLFLVVIKYCYFKAKWLKKFCLLELPSWCCCYFFLFNVTCIWEKLMIGNSSTKIWFLVVSCGEWSELWSILFTWCHLFLCRNAFGWLHPAIWVNPFVFFIVIILISGNKCGRERAERHFPKLVFGFFSHESFSCFNCK